MPVKLDDEQTVFDVETFAKLVALFDSPNTGEGQNAYRKAVVMCTKNGLTFDEGLRQTYGRSNGDAELQAENAELRERAEKAEKDGGRLSELLTEARAEVAALQGGREEWGEHEHVIDFGGRLRRAWRFPQFRLLVLTLIIASGVKMRPGGIGFALAVLSMFGAWSLAQFRKQGLGQMLLKWAVYIPVVMVGAMTLSSMDADSPGALYGLLAAAMLLTLSKVSEWLGEQVRMHVWESGPVRVVRKWF